MWQDFGLILAGLFLFGVGFNWLTELAERRGWIEGYTALFVVIGVAVTVAGTGFVIGWLHVLYLMLAFGASGLPMIVGSIVRYARARERAQKELRNYEN